MRGTLSMLRRFRLAVALLASVTLPAVAQIGNTPISGGSAPPLRTYLNATQTLWVVSGGSDSNNCVTFATGCATLQGAVNKAYQLYDTGSASSFTISLQNATTYTGSTVVTGQLLGGAPLTIAGSGGAATLSAVSGVVLQVTNGANVTLRNLTFTSTGSGIPPCLSSAAGSYLAFSTGLTFGQCIGPQIESKLGSVVISNNPYTISGGGDSHLHIHENSQIVFDNITITCTGSPAYTSYFVGVGNGFFEAIGQTYSGCGTVTGPRFTANRLGAIRTDAYSATYFPGNSAGTLASNAVFDDVGGIEVGLPSVSAITPYCGTGAAAVAQACTAGALLPGTAQVLTTSTSFTLPSGWTQLDVELAGGGGGGACGYVVTSGTAISGGGGGAPGTYLAFSITAAQVGNATNGSVTIGAAGTGCTASGTTSGSSGAGQTAGGNTSISINGIALQIAYGGGYGSNGSTTVSAGGGSGGWTGAGGNAAGSTAGAAGASGGTIGGSGAASGLPTNFGVGAGGNGSPLGTVPGAGVYGGTHAGSAPAGAGLAATPVALAGANGGNSYGTQLVQAVGGLATCAAGSQNGSAPANVVSLHGKAGGSGASCTAANGGNAGAGAGYSAGGAGGGSTLAGFTAGNGANGLPGAIILKVR